MKESSNGSRLDKGDLEEAEWAIEMAGNVDLSKYLSVTPNAPKSIGQQIDETFCKMQSHAERWSA